MNFGLEESRGYKRQGSFDHRTVTLTEPSHQDGGSQRLSGSGGGRGWKGRYSNQGNSGEKKKRPGGMVPRRVEELPEPVALLKKIITTFADYSNMSSEEIKTSALIRSAAGVAAVMVKVGEIYEFTSEIEKIFIKCFSQLSVPIPIISLLVALIHREEIKAENQETTEDDANMESDITERHFCDDLVGRSLRMELLQAIRDGEVLRARLLLRVVACLLSCNSFSVQSFLGVIFGLLEASEETGEVSPSSNRIAEAAFLLACTIPWSISALTEARGREPRVDEALNRLENFFSKLLGQGDDGWAELVGPYRVGGKHEVFHSHPPIPYDGEFDGYLSVDPCNTKPGVARDSLFEASTFALQLISAATAQQTTFLPNISCHIFPWTEARAMELLTPEPLRYMTFGAENDVHEAVLTACRYDNTAHCLSSSGIFSSPCCRQGQWLSPKLCIFDKDTSPEAEQLCRTLSPLERYLAATYYTDILVNFQPVINDDGTKLGSVELLANHLLAVSRVFPSEEESEEGPHLEYLLVEVLFQQLLQPPTHLFQSNNAGHFKLVLHLCRRDPIFPPVVALAANIVFQMVPELQPASWREFARWFTFHLTNTKLTWPYWEFWISELQSSLSVSADRDVASNGDATMVRSEGYSAQSILIHFVVDHCTRASIAEKIKRAVPGELEKFIPFDSRPYCPLLDQEYQKADNSTTNGLNDRSFSSVDINNGVSTAEDGDGQEEASSALDESLLSADTNMAVVVPLSLGQVNASSTSSLFELAFRLKELIGEKTDPEDVEDWINTNRKEIWALHFVNDELREQIEDVNDSADPSSCGNDDTLDAASANLLLQAILSIGGKQTAALYGLVGLLDRYSEVLRGVSLPENEKSHAVMMSTLARAFNRDHGTFLFILDEMLRRGLIAVTAAADWLTNQKSSSGTNQDGSLFLLLKDPYVYEMWESVIDRTLDFVRAAVGQRKELGGFMVMDEFMDFTPAPSSFTDSNRRAHPPTLSDEPEGSAEDFTIGVTTGKLSSGAPVDDIEVDYTEDVDEEEDERDREGRRRTRLRTDNGSYIETSSEALVGLPDQGNASDAESAVLAAAALVGQQRGLRQEVQIDGDSGEEEDPVQVYSELVKQAIANARKVFRTMVGTLVQTHGGPNEAGVTFWQSICGSLLRRVLISFSDAEILLSFQHQQRIVLTDRRSRVESLIAGTEEDDDDDDDEDAGSAEQQKKHHAFLSLWREINRD